MVEAQSEDSAREASVRSVDRALRILESVGKSATGLSAQEISSATSLPVSTVYRLLETLIHRGFIVESATSGLFVTGTKAFEVAASFHGTQELVDIADPVMIELARNVKETVNLAAIIAGTATYLHQVEAPEMLMRMFMQTGKPAPCHCSGVGKVLLAWASEKDAENLRASIEFTAFTLRTITTIEELEYEIVRIRQRGYALDDEEREAGVRCVAVPILSAHRRLLGALSISGPTSRVTSERVSTLYQELSHVATTIGLTLR